MNDTSIGAVLHLRIVRGLILVRRDDVLLWSWPMKTLCFALLFAATVTVVAGAPQNNTPQQTPRNVPGTPFTDAAIYLRDVEGRCLRLQLQPMANGQLSVLVMPNDACARREQAGKK